MLLASSDHTGCPFDTPGNQACIPSIDFPEFFPQQVELGIPRTPAVGSFNTRQLLSVDFDSANSLRAIASAATATRTIVSKLSIGSSIQSHRGSVVSFIFAELLSFDELCTQFFSSFGKARETTLISPLYEFRVPNNKFPAC